MNQASIFGPLMSYLVGTSQKFLSVLSSLLQDTNFLTLSETGILKLLNESDQIQIPKTSYQCSIKFLVNELLNFSKKRQKLDNTIVKNLGGLIYYRN